MSSKVASKDRRRTTMVSITSMEELPVLSAEEQAKLRAQLEAAEARIAAGEGVDDDRDGVPAAADRHLSHQKPLSLCPISIRFDPVAMHHIEEFAAYLCSYSEDFAIEQIDRLKSDHLISYVPASPRLGRTSPSAAPPTAPISFCVARRTQDWIVYNVDDDARTVDILHFWNAMRDPESFEV